MTTSKTLREAKLTPKEIAERYGCTTAKIINWIRSGELRAIDAGSRAGSQRPRYLIDEEDLRLFELRRSVHAAPARRSRRRRTPADVVEFF